MAIRLFLLLLALLAPSAAAADVSGRWTSPRDVPGLRIEVSSAGDARITYDGVPGAYVLLRGSEIYHIYQRPDRQFVVVRAADMRRMVQERVVIRTAPPRTPALRMVAGPPEQVEGRRGTSYFAAGDPTLAGAPLVVMSDDAAMAPLGRAFAVGIELAFGYSDQAGGLLDRARPIFELMQRGTPLRYGSLVLTGVDHSRIDPRRLALPAEPLTLEQIRRGMAAPWIPGDQTS